MAFDSLFKVRLGYIRLIDCPTGLGNWSAGLEPHAGARNRSKATEKRCQERDYTLQNK